MTDKLTFIRTSVKRTGEKVETGVYKPVLPSAGIPDNAGEIIEKEGVLQIPFTTFNLLRRLTGKTYSREETAAKNDLTELLGVDLTVSPHCIVKITNKDNPDGFDILIVKSNNPEIKRSVSGNKGAKDKYVISVQSAVQSALARWGKTPDDVLGILLSDYSVRRKRFKEGLPIVYDFTGVPVEPTETEQFTFLVKTRWGNESDRITYTNVTYKAV